MLLKHDLPAESYNLPMLSMIVAKYLAISEWQPLPI